VVIAIGLAVGCSGSSDRSTTVNVFAAASLTDAFGAVETAFKAVNPDVDVVLNLAASSALATQIVEGAPADVFASADETNMNRIADLIDESAPVFATNRLQIVTEPGNPLGIASLDDLGDPSILFVTSAPEVPIGRYTAEVLTRAGVNLRPVSYEESVKGILTKVRTGEADAGIVYSTDVTAAGSSVTGVDIADEYNVIARYPIARLTISEAAATFVDFVLSSAGRSILDEFGFGAP
jgi:molybdate transport system substrate-binding protein